MNDVQPAAPETSQLPPNPTLHEAADLLASYRTAPQELGEAATGPAESVIEETPDQDQPEMESSEEGSLEEVTEDAEDSLESLADGDTDQPEELEAEAAIYDIEGEEISLDTIKDWRESGMRQDDYQRKTQVLAQQTQAVGEIEKKLNGFAHASTQMHKQRLSKIEQSIKQYSTVDWPKLAQEDQQKFTVHQAQFQQLKDQYQGEQRQFAGFVEGFHKLSEDATAKRAEAAYPEIKQRVKGWSEARYHELREHLTTKLGADPAHVNQITDPWFWELANDAYTYRNGKALKTGKQKIRRPTKTLKAKAPVTAEDPGARLEKDGLAAINKASTSRNQMEVAAELMRQRRERKK